MEERPILFNGPMVRAILEGRKTQTRRVVKLDGFDEAELYETRNGDLVDPITLCPHGVPGDRLWVRETFWQPIHYYTESAWINSLAPLHYAAEGDPANTPNETYPDGLQGGYIAAPDPYARWVKHPSIHMPRWASRILLEVVEVRVERVKGITFIEAKAEGVDYEKGYTNPRDAFERLWDSINAKRGFGWDVNPWVWVVTFKRIEG